MKCSLIRRPGQASPFPHGLGMMSARIAEKDMIAGKDMDEHEHGRERLDRFQETDRRGGADGQGLDHLSEAG
jgi:hypothetical protein